MAYLLLLLPTSLVIFLTGVSFRLKIEKMTKKRKLSSNMSPIKVEVKEENVLGNDYLMAKGRLKGVLKQLTEKSESDSDSSDERSSR